MKGRKDRFARVETINIEVTPIDAKFPAPIVNFGNSYYIRLDPKIMSYYKLDNKDWVLVTLHEVRRVKSEDANEKITK